MWNQLLFDENSKQIYILSWKSIRLVGALHAPQSKGELYPPEIAAKYCLWDRSDCSLFRWIHTGDPPLCHCQHHHFRWLVSKFIWIWNFLPLCFTETFFNKIGFDSKVSAAYPMPSSTSEISFSDYEILLPVISSLIVVVVIVAVACFLCSRDHHSLFLQPGLHSRQRQQCKCRARPSVA